MGDSPTIDNQRGAFMCLDWEFFNAEAQRKRERSYARLGLSSIAETLTCVRSTTYPIATEMAAWLSKHRPEVVAKLSPEAQLNYHYAMVMVLEYEVAAQNAATDGFPQGCDQVAFASHQPDKAKGANQLATAFVRALSKVKTREGVLIAQLDELLIGASQVFEQATFLPDEPVVLCLTGSPEVIASMKFYMLPRQAGPTFAIARAPGYLQVLRVAAVVNDGRIVVHGAGGLGGRSTDVLTKAGWTVTTATVGLEDSDESDEALRAQMELSNADSTLKELSRRPPTPFVPQEEKVAVGTAGMKPKLKGLAARIAAAKRQRT
jgi:hypothetical protein